MHRGTATPLWRPRQCNVWHPVPEPLVSDGKGGGMQERATVCAGADTHKDFHVPVILDSLGRPVSSGSFSADEEGHKQLAEEIGDPSGCMAVGMEGTTSYGAGLRSYLMESGHAAFEALRPKREKRRVGEGRTDGIDAEHAARAVAAGKGMVPKSHNGWVEGLRALAVARSIHVNGSVVK